MLVDATFATTVERSFTQCGVAIRKQPKAVHPRPMAVQNGLFFTFTMNGMAKTKRIWLNSLPDMRYAASFDLMPNCRSKVDSVADK